MGKREMLLTSMALVTVESRWRLRWTLAERDGAKEAGFELDIGLEPGATIVDAWAKAGRLMSDGYEGPVAQAFAAMTLKPLVVGS